MEHPRWKLMKELITPVPFSHMVSAMELHTALCSKEPFYDWFLKHRSRYGFVEYEDYIVSVFLEVDGDSFADFGLSLATAAKIAGMDDGENAESVFKSLIAFDGDVLSEVEQWLKDLQEERNSKPIPVCIDGAKAEA